MMEKGYIQPPEVIARSPVEEFTDYDHLFHSHEHDDRLQSSGTVDDALLSGEHRAEIPVPNGGLSEAARSASVGSEAPVSPSGSSNMVKPNFPQSIADIEKQFSPEGIEAKLTEGLPTAPADKAQQLIDQYGTEGGVRRFKEMGPDAAERFERERPPEPSRESPKDDGYSDDQPPDDAP